MNEQFETYDAFLNWLGSSYPEDISTTAKGSSFRDFVARLLPETTRGRRFGRLKANPKQSHDFGVDVFSADPSTDQLALQSKFFIGEKAHIDGIISAFRNYETRLHEMPEGQLFTDEGPAMPRLVYAIATASRIGGIVAEYEKSHLSSRAFYDDLKAEGRLLIWDGEDLRRDALQLNARHFEMPLKVELSSTAGEWLHDGRVWLGIVEARDLTRLEAEHEPGLFYENVRGWLGLEGGRDGETVNQSIRNTVVDAPAEMLARNNGVTFRASEVEPTGEIRSSCATPRSSTAARPPGR